MRKIYLSLIALFIIQACSKVPITGRRQLNTIPSDQIMALSEESYKEVIQKTGISDNNLYIQQVNRVGNRLSAAVEEFLRNENDYNRVDDFEWQFNVLKSESLNAFCMPGGKIGFFEGIIPVCEDDNGIAVVMAHEIAHAIAKHGNERMSQQLLVELGGMALATAVEDEKETTQQLALIAFGVGSQIGVMLPYSRMHEQEADELGLYFMAYAGYDPREAPLFWERMQARGGQQPPEFLSTHPHPQNRIEYIKSIMDKAMDYYNNSMNR